MTLEEVMALFGYTSKRNARTCIREGTFPVPMEKQRGKWVVDAQVVRHYFEFKRRYAMEEVERRIKEEHRKLTEANALTIRAQQ
jgi:hypothetical protein